MFTVDFFATRYLQEKLPAHCEFYPLAFHLHRPTNEQEPLDLALLNKIHHTGCWVL